MKLLGSAIFITRYPNKLVFCPFSLLSKTEPEGFFSKIEGHILLFSSSDSITERATDYFSAPSPYIVDLYVCQFSTVFSWLVFCPLAYASEFFQFSFEEKFLGFARSR
ncbi:hypothetical protein ES706_04835 [subsurface metagenome]